jgi:hypothetical protein
MSAPRRPPPGPERVDGDSVDAERLPVRGEDELRAILFQHDALAATESGRAQSHRLAVSQAMEDRVTMGRYVRGLGASGERTDAEQEEDCGDGEASHGRLAVAGDGMLRRPRDSRVTREDQNESCGAPQVAQEPLAALAS